MATILPPKRFTTVIGHGDSDKLPASLEPGRYTLAGASPRTGRMIVLEFPSEAQARAWSADAGYQALSEHRRAGARLEFLTMVRGLPPR